jgi:hypothetical protein
VPSSGLPLISRRLNGSGKRPVPSSGLPLMTSFCAKAGGGETYWLTEVVGVSLMLHTVLLMFDVE